jgi:DNA polymerase III delta subunit
VTLSLASTENLKPCYFFFGEETFLAQQFLQKLIDILFHESEEDRHIERCRTDEKSWGEIIDIAREIPFFSSRRLIVAEVTNSKAKLSSIEEKILTGYFETCSSQTVLVIVYAGRVKRSAPLVKFFSSLPRSAVVIEEMKPLRDRALLAWADDKFRALHKIPTPEALHRLVEVTGSDLTQIDSEIEKISLFTGERERVNLDDVNLTSGWVKSFFEWEMGDSLEKGDYQQSLIVLDKLLNKEGIKPEFVMGSFSWFFAKILLAKLSLEEKTKDKKSIFKEFKPQIQEKFGSFYTRKFNEFFALMARFTVADLSRFLGLLEEIDLKIKTSDVPLQVQLEGFLFEYCRWISGGRIIFGGKS